jgi:enolase-phosphatase E1
MGIAHLENIVEKVVLLDIEGTITPVDFVTRTLFPYARKNLIEFIEQSSKNASAKITLEKDFLNLKIELDRDIENGTYAPIDQSHRDSDLISYLFWLMDHDKKSPGLKSLQGRIWENGYKSGELKGELYPDVLPAINAWRAAGKIVCIYSSGSILAQQLLFQHLPEGDLSNLITSHFDTSSGPKRESSSYLSIASTLGVQTNEILFLSDTPEELQAAKAVGMNVTLVQRK